jgi:VWFA-related protein
MLQTRKLAILVVLVFGLAQGGAAQQPAGGNPQPAPPPGGDAPAQDPAAAAGQDPQTTFRAGINFVRVDVIVTDRKETPVTDLAKEDFEVLEDGKAQPIEQFRLIKVDGMTRPGDPPPRRIRSRDDEQQEASREDVRIFGIVLDDYHVRKSMAMSVRIPLTQFIRTQLRPHDLLAVMYPLTPVRELLFTNDHESIIRAIEGFEGRKHDYTPRNTFEQQYMRASTQDVERIRNEVTMSALKALSVRMGSMREGRKSIIFVSEGFTALLPPQLQRPDASKPAGLPVGLENPLEAEARAAAQADSPRQQTAEWFAQSEVYMKMREVFQDANRNNTSIYSLDPRGLAVFEYDIDATLTAAALPSFATDRRVLQATQDTLRVLADETDGRAIVNRNDLADGLTQLVRDSSFYYLLGFNSQVQNDGKFHEIKVRIKRPGVEVRARRGYWALTAADVTRAENPTPDLAKPVAAALATLAAASPQSGKYVRTWVGTERGENGKTRVTIVWEPLPQPPGVRREQPGRVSLLAANAAGDLVFRGTSPDAALASARTAAPANDVGLTSVRAPAAAAATVPQQLVFDAAPGTIELRMTVQEAGTGGTLDQEIRTIAVPDLTAPGVAISTPRVYRGRTARDIQVVAADGAAVPVATREFSRTERLLIRFDAYAPGSEQPQPTAALLNRTGQKMSDVPVTAAATGGTHQISLGLSSVPAGEYLVEITVKGTGDEAKELVPLRVGS